MNIAGNTILITGGTSGIGLGFAKEFLKLGNTIIICGRRKERLQKIREEFPEIIIKQCDVADDKQRAGLFFWIKENHPQLNVLINNAGVQLYTKIVSDTDIQRLRAEVETNFTAPVHLNSLFIDLLKTREEPVIINISSGLAFVPLAFIPIYCATKAALHSYILSLRYQLKGTPVRVFEIAPPAVDTELGNEWRTSPSHGGISVSEFIAETMPTLEADVFEAAIGQSKGLWAKREEVFGLMNR
ncbi:MAG: SDR family NAD(P)-dependent oxidoreductase [Bacteroidetes bacterium]|nr:SDR family NAD(P)-dependent oxidoreductase [Bacteroidota bacterium]